MAAAQQLQMKGRYMSKVLKYCGGSLIFTATAGVACYALVSRRIKRSEGYLHTLTEEKISQTDARVMKYAGFDRNEKYPNIPFIDNSKGDYDEAIKKFSYIESLWFLERQLLSAVDPDVNEYLPDLFLNGIRENWFDSEAKKKEAQKRLFTARLKFVDNVKNFKGRDGGQNISEEFQTSYDRILRELGGDSKSNQATAFERAFKQQVESKGEKFLLSFNVMVHAYVTQLLLQTNEGVQEEAVPIANKFIQKLPMPE